MAYKRFTLERRPGAEHTSDRLLMAVEVAFNNHVDYLCRYPELEADRIKEGFRKSQYIDEWFDWSRTREGLNYWSMANHLFTVYVQPKLIDGLPGSYYTIISDFEESKNFTDVEILNLKVELTKVYQSGIVVTDPSVYPTISSMFNWSNSPQNRDFWNKVYAKMYGVPFWNEDDLK